MAGSDDSLLLEQHLEVEGGAWVLRLDMSKQIREVEGPLYVRVAVDLEGIRFQQRSDALINQVLLPRLEAYRCQWHLDMRQTASDPGETIEYRGRNVASLALESTRPSGAAMLRAALQEADEHLMSSTFRAMSFSRHVGVHTYRRVFEAMGRPPAPPPYLVFDKGIKPLLAMAEMGWKAEAEQVLAHIVGRNGTLPNFSHELSQPGGAARVAALSNLLERRDLLSIDQLLLAPQRSLSGHGVPSRSLSPAGRAFLAAVNQDARTHLLEQAKNLVLPPKERALLVGEMEVLNQVRAFAPRDPIMMAP